MSWQDGTRFALPSCAGVLQSGHLGLAPDARSVARARRFVQAQAPALAPARLEDVVLMTSELVTNAVIHAGTELVLAVSVSEDHVAVTVFDLDLGRREPVGQDRNGGRGLHIVEALACASGQGPHPRGGGKTTWFRVCRADHVDHEREGAAFA